MRQAVGLGILAVLSIVVLFAIMFAQPALAKISERYRAGYRASLHTAHFDVATAPNRAERRRISARGMGRLLWMVPANEVGAVTLAQAKLNATDDIDVAVIDEFAKGSFLFENITFDDVVNPAGGGATLTYGYTRKATHSAAQFRAFNAEYTPSEATKTRHTVDLKVFGGAFEIDRVLARVGATSEVTLQMQDKIAAARELFHDTAINGDTAVDANSFDGLNKALVGTSTEYGASAEPLIDLSSSTLMDDNANAFIDLLDDFLSTLQGRPTFLGANGKLIAKIKSIARRLGYFSTTETAFGNKISAYDGIPLVDLGEKPDSSNPVVPIYAAGAASGMTDLYAVRLGLDGFHGVSLAGQQLINTWLPDFDTAGAVKKGEVEVVAAVALKATKAAGVMRRIKVQ